MTITAPRLRAARRIRPTPLPVRPERFAHLPPNWFAVVMGTGIIAVAAHGMPGHPAFLTPVAVVFWALACVVFVPVAGATAVQWLRHPHIARGHRRHAVTAHFYGAVPMATLTVGTSTLVGGSTVIGHDTALVIDLVCFGVGTVGGVITAVTIGVPHLLGRRGDRTEAFGGWLMSVVPPTVSASSAALLAATVTPAWARWTLMAVGVACLLCSIAVSAPILAMVLRRLVTGGVGAAPMVPTWWIVLGPLGQSVTAAGLLAVAPAGLVDPATLRLLDQLAVGYAVPVWSLALAWIGIAAAVTAHTVRSGMPFALTWWSFTFPVGTFVTGSSVLAAATGLAVFAVVAWVAGVALLAAWLVVAGRTLAGLAATDGRPHR
ncbi:TDT family transporter [Gordonia sp. NB41Y]|uniref:SLAC1 family transporter n=1 Tax=Gordonia sp. NB41Y TaxID=875808 RepID=UPI0006B1DFC4|nr:TDT family transporter [Gordonia sp. NB41Y]KOY49170.1 TDT family transporter [Gordonia sp. NB41Y]WLP89439.1 TDT family transporter [Gordonia sp. NB41Y]